jgi:acyl-ACP thioesterase
LKIAMTTLPPHGATIRVETWPSGFDRLFALRQFRLFGEDGAEFAVASSHWVLLDAERLRPLRVKELLENRLPPHGNLPVYFPELDKLERRAVGRPMSIHVGDSMIDINFHMNNARYAGMAADWLAEARPTAQIRELQVNYVQATRPGAELQVVGAVDGPRFDVEIREGDQLHCQLAGTFIGDASPLTV